MIKFIVSQNTKDMLYWFNLKEKTENTIKVWLPEAERHPIELEEWADKHLKNHDNTKEIVIATHSSRLISVIGDYIEDDQISHLDVSVDVIHNGKLDGVSHFDKDGDFINWPIGFFYIKMEDLKNA